MTILLLGRNGQVGWELQRALAPLDDIIALDRETQDGLCGDLSRPADLGRSVANAKPDIIVNAAAYTAVDQAEDEADRARLINSEAPAALADAAATADALLVHYSTDYVFDGGGSRPWREDDPTEPVNVYGATKRAGEEAVRASGCRHLILRTSRVHSPRRGNFLRKILAAVQERDHMQVIDDEVGAPTGADLIADITAHLIAHGRRRELPNGIFHMTASGAASWFDYAAFITEHARKRGLAISASLEPVSADDYARPATRPRNCRLDCSALVSRFGLTLPDWRFGVERTLNELIDAMTSSN